MGCKASVPLVQPPAAGDKQACSPPPPPRHGTSPAASVEVAAEHDGAGATGVCTTGHETVFDGAAVCESPAPHSDADGLRTPHAAAAAVQPGTAERSDLPPPIVPRVVDAAPGAPPLWGTEAAAAPGSDAADTPVAALPPPEAPVEDMVYPVDVLCDLPSRAPPAPSSPLSVVCVPPEHVGDEASEATAATGAAQHPQGRAGSPSAPPAPVRVPTDAPAAHPAAGGEGPEAGGGGQPAGSPPPADEATMLQWLNGFMPARWNTAAPPPDDGTPVGGSPLGEHEPRAAEPPPEGPPPCQDAPRAKPPAGGCPPTNDAPGAKSPPAGTEGDASDVDASAQTSIASAVGNFVYDNTIGSFYAIGDVVSQAAPAAALLASALQPCTTYLTELAVDALVNTTHANMLHYQQKMEGAMGVQVEPISREAVSKAVRKAVRQSGLVTLAPTPQVDDAPGAGEAGSLPPGGCAAGASDAGS